MARNRSSCRHLLWKALPVGAALLSSLGAYDSALAQTRTFPASLSREQRQQLSNDLNSSLTDFDRTSPRDRLPKSNLTAPTQELERIRPLVSDASSELQQLILDLGDESQRRPSLKPVLVDAMNLQAKLTVTIRRAQQTNDHRYLADDFRTLNGLWRELSYQLSRFQGLNKRTVDRIANLDGIGKEIGQILLIQPQLNTDQLLRKTVQLSSDIQNLLEDIEYEVPNAKERGQLVLQGNRMLQQVRDLTSLVQDGSDQAVIVDAYRRFQELWYPQAAKLQTYESRYIERDLRRITQETGEIHQLLLLPQKVEKQQLLYLTATLKKDIDEFFERTPLVLLVHLPKANNVLATADEFYGVCEHFVDVVNRDEDMEAVIEAFRYIESAEKTFAATFRPIESESALAVLRQVEQTIGTLRTTLMVQRDDFSRQSAINLVAEVDNLAYNLQAATRRWVQNDRVSFSNEAMQEVTAFADQATRLHEQLLSGATAAQTRRATEELYDSWRRVYTYLVKCQTEDRAQLGRLASRITPTLVELRTMLAQ